MVSLVHSIACLFVFRFLLKRLFQYQAATEAGVLQPHGFVSHEHPTLAFTQLNIPKQAKHKVKKQVLRRKEDKGNLSKTTNALHRKITQAKLAAQAKNLAKLAGHRTPAKPLVPKSPPQVSESVKDATQQPLPPIQSDEGTYIYYSYQQIDHVQCSQ